MPELYPFQKEGVKFLTSRRSALLADVPGLGKTVQALKAVERINAQKVLVVCPAIVKLNWEREIRTWLKNPGKIQIIQKRSDSPDPTARFIIINYDLLISPSIFKTLIRMSFGVGIFDESHFLKNRTAKRTKAVLLRGGVASRCAYKYFLTGTPVLNRPVELYPVLKAAAPHIIEPYTSFDSFARRYCGAYWDGFQLVATGATNMDELCAKLSGGPNAFMLRRRKEEVLKDLPAKQYQMISLPAADAKTKEIVKKEFTFSRDDARAVDISGTAEISILRHQLALSKLPMCIEHIKEVLESEPKVVVFAYHRDVIEKLWSSLLEYIPCVITGATSALKRQDAINAFQTEPLCRVFIGQIQAAGVGITLTAASTVIFVESSWVPGEIEQAVDRCHRIGQKDSVLAQFLVIKDSLEEFMIKTIIEKREVIERIVDQDPSVAEMFL